MYLTRIAGIETGDGSKTEFVLTMYLTRIAGIETDCVRGAYHSRGDVSYPHSGN